MTTPLDKKLRVQFDEGLACAKYSRDALGDLILMAEEADAYHRGYAYASVAIVWGRKEHDRLSRVIQDAEQS